MSRSFLIPDGHKFTSPCRLPAQRFVTPDAFRALRERAPGKGFAEAVAGPLVRSSRRAERALEHDHPGL